MTHEYDDIIHLPHHVSKRHPQMSMEARAAQFAPFAALTGHSEAIQETARLTDEQITLDDNTIKELNQQMLILQSQEAEHPLVSITYFKPDLKKSGGSYKVWEGRLVRIEELTRRIILDNESTIEFQHVAKIEIKERDT